MPIIILLLVARIPTHLNKLVIIFESRYQHIYIEIPKPTNVQETRQHETYLAKKAYAISY